MAITKQTKIEKIDISGEDAEVQAVANAVWTDDVKGAWLEHKASLDL